MTNSPSLPEYEQLTQSAGFVELVDQCFVQISGKDRKKQLHSFCTAEINKRESGEVFEAFVLNTKGKILGFVNVFNGEDDLLLTGHGAQADTLIKHLDMYVIREDAKFHDASAELTGLFVCGPQSVAKLESLLGSAAGELPAAGHFQDVSVDGVELKVGNMEIAGDGFLLVCNQESKATLTTLLEANNISQCSLDTLEIVRIENQTPWFGRDADDSTLPQELERDEKAISFTKGCYLGQETVARIDALGRVNQILVGLRFDTGVEASVGMELVENEKVVGRVTSVSKLPNEESWIGLGYVRRKFIEHETRVGKAIVIRKQSDS